VPDDQLSLAIGKKGQNVRLAAKLINWKIDIKSESHAQEEEEQGDSAAEAEEKTADAEETSAVVEETAVEQDAVDAANDGDDEQVQD